MITSKSLQFKCTLRRLCETGRWLLTIYCALVKSYITIHSEEVFFFTDVFYIMCFHGEILNILPTGNLT